MKQITSQSVEQYPNGSTAITTIERRKKHKRRPAVNMVVYDVYLVGQRGWRTEVAIKSNNWRQRRAAALQQEWIATHATTRCY